MPTKRKTTKRSGAIPARWLKLFRLLPGGYDPVKTAKGSTFDAKAADGAIAFFEERLHHIKGEKARQAFDLENWQKAIVGCVFGWKRADGMRRYREVYMELPRKNGKTTLAAGVALYTLFVDQEWGAENYCCAAERDQAALTFNLCRAMVESDRELSAEGRCMKHTIEYPARRSFVKAISAEPGTKHGFNCHCVVDDELHAHRDRELIDVLQTGMGSRTQPLMWHITTAGHDRNSICYEKHEYAAAVADSKNPFEDESFLPIIYAASEDEDWRDEKVWAKANPNLGVSVKLEYLRGAFKKAKRMPAFENTFKQLHLNIWTESSERWMSSEVWDACGDESLGVVVNDRTVLAGRSCFAGLDMSSTTDLTALVLAFPNEATDTTSSGFDIYAEFWAPLENAKDREAKDRAPYTLWSSNGHLHLTDGNVVDYDAVRTRINELGQVYNIRQIAIDRWNSTQLQTQLMGDGFEIVQFGQGFASMSSPTKEVMRLCLDEDLHHPCNPVLTWCVSNAVAEIDAAENIKLSKKKSTERIDGAIALVMAVGTAMLAGPQVDQSYEVFYV